MISFESEKPLEISIHPRLRSLRNAIRNKKNSTNQAEQSSDKLDACLHRQHSTTNPNDGDHTLKVTWLRLELDQDFEIKIVELGLTL